MQFKVDTINQNLNIARECKRKGDIDTALRYYEDIIKIDPTHFVAWLHIAKLHYTKGQFDRSVDCCQRGIELRPKDDRSYIQLAQILKQQEKSSEAIQVYKQAIELNPKQPFGVYKTIGILLFQEGRFDEAILAYKEAIKLSPNRHELYTSLAKAQVKVGSIDEAISSYQKAIELNSDPPLWIRQHLANALKQKEYTKSSSLPLDTHQSVYLDIWNALNQTSLESLIENTSYPTDIDPSLVDSFFLQASQYKVIKLTTLSQQDKLFLEANQISLSYLKQIEEDDAAKQEAYLQHFGCDLEIKPHRNTDRFSIEFQQSMIETGYIYTICPISQKVLRSNQSFLFVPGPALGIYRFVGNRIFYLILGKAPFEKQAIYYPDLELIVHFSSRELNTERVVNQFKSFIVSHWQQAISYINSDCERKIVATLGFHTTPSHHILNELSGIERLYKSDLLDRVDKFIVGHHVYFGSLCELFPEISSDKVINFTDSEKSKVPKFILGNNYFALGIRDTFISEDLATRVYNLSLKKCDSSFLKIVDEAKQHFPLIFITVRTGSNRAWVSQIEGLANLIEKLSLDFPNLGVIFDGVSRVEQRDISLSRQGSQEEEWMQKDRATVDQVLARLPNNCVSTYNSVGCMMYESIVWANAADFYIAPFGGGLTKVTLIAKKPGVVHTNRTILKSKMRNYWYTEYQREKAIAPVYISDKFITDAKISSSIKNTRDSFMYDAYDFDFEILYHEISKVIPNSSRKGKLKQVK